MLCKWVYIVCRLDFTLICCIPGINVFFDLIKHWVCVYACMCLFASPTTPWWEKGDLDSIWHWTLSRPWGICNICTNLSTKVFDRLFHPQRWGICFTSISPHLAPPGKVVVGHAIDRCIVSEWNYNDRGVGRYLCEGEAVMGVGSGGIKMVND